MLLLYFCKTWPRELLLSVNISFFRDQLYYKDREKKNFLQRQLSLSKIIKRKFYIFPNTQNFLV